MEVITIDVESVVQDKFKPSDPRFSKAPAELIKNIARSIETDGQINPITVVKHPTEEGKYLPVTGRKRLAAMKLLNRPGILAVVSEPLDEFEMESAIIADNLWRATDSPAERTLKVKRWLEIWAIRRSPKGEARPPEEVDGKKESVRARLARDAKAAADEVQSPGKAPKPAKKTRKEASEEIKALEGTGVPKRTAQREVAIAGALTEDQLESLASVDASLVALERIAGVKDDDKRAEAVESFVKSGDLDESVGGEPEAGPPGDGELSDTEWVDKFCADTIGRLSGTTSRNVVKFITACGVYRNTRKARQSFARVVRPVIGKVSSDAESSNLVRQLFKIAYLAHPKDWPVCLECKGEGFKDRAGSPARCNKCFGDGFVISTENPKDK